MRILLAEDGEDHARIIIAVLKRHNFEVIHFTTGTDAYAHLTLHPQPDLLITDIMMPGISGFELMRRLKEEHIIIPTIVLTSRQRDEDILQGLEYGVLDYIVKPFSPTVTIAKIKNALKRSAS